MAGTHARYSASGADGWSACADWTSDPTGSKYANRGSAIHELAYKAGIAGKPATDFAGHIIHIEGENHHVDDEMIEIAQAYLDEAIDGETFLEQRLPISQITGEADANSTADRITLAQHELIIDDLKTGRGIKVDAEYNKQLGIYAKAAVDHFSLLYDFTHVRMRIIQPPLGHVSEWALSVEALDEFINGITIATKVAPGEKQCRWCSKKATCQALAASVSAEFEAIQPVSDADDARLAKALAKVELIEAWCRAVYAEAEQRIKDGKQIPGYKLVDGKKGARAWDDEKTVEDMLKAMRLRQDEMYQFKLMSPTQLEKALKDNPKRWAKLQEHITQKSGSPVVVPVTDKRSPISTVCSTEFQPISEAA